MGRNVDADLAGRLMAREEAALNDAVKLYGGVVHGMARRIVAESSLAEEVAQDTFVALWRRPGAYDPARGSLQAFLLGVARNKGVDLVRREEARRRASDALMAEAEIAPSQETPNDQLEERQRVKEALSTLSYVQREAIVLAYFGGRTYREVAEELDIPEGTAKTRLRDGLMKLRDLMSNSSRAEGE